MQGAGRGGAGPRGAGASRRNEGPRSPGRRWWGAGTRRTERTAFPWLPSRPSPLPPGTCLFLPPHTHQTQDTRRPRRQGRRWATAVRVGRTEGCALTRALPHHTRSRRPCGPTSAVGRCDRPWQPAAGAPGGGFLFHFVDSVQNKNQGELTADLQPSEPGRRLKPPCVCAPDSGRGAGHTVRPHRQSGTAGRGSARGPRRLSGHQSLRSEAQPAWCRDPVSLCARFADWQLRQMVLPLSNLCRAMLASGFDY